MMNTLAIYQELSGTLGNEAAMKIAAVMGKIYDELKNSVTKDEFKDLRNIVAELAEAQKRTEIKIEELVEAQKRTEIKIEELVEAQKRTEIKVEELAEAQNRTEIKVEELAEAQRHTEIKADENFKSLRDQIAALGSRWGIYNEGTFRATIHGLLGKMPGVTVKEGNYGGRQIDVIIRNGEHIMLEITSRMGSGDIDKLYRSADDYFEQEGIQPVLMIATAYISPKLMQKVMGLSRTIDIFSYEPE
jgi:hypothetical protein